MKEAYVSFKTAKLLKGKGFEQHSCAHSYNSKGVFKWSDDFDPYEYSTPTQQMAMAWLREVHNIFITIYCGRDGYCDEPYFRATWQRLDDEPIEYPIGDCDYSYYETCVEAALKYVLENLI